MLSEHRLQIYLPKGLYGRLLDKARKDGKSIAQVVRESVSMYLSRTPKEAAMERFAGIDKLVGSLQDDGSGAAESHDEALGSSGRW